MQGHELPPPVAMMHMVFGRFVSQAIGTAAKLGLADHLVAGPKSADELATAAKAHGPSVYRLLRALASIGVFAEQDPGRFVNTPLSETLLDRPGSARPLAVFFNEPTHLKAWTAIDYSVTTGKIGFEHALGANMWDYAGAHPEFAAVFNSAMTAISAQFAPAVAAAYDFAGFQTLADIGGGHGMLLGTILAKTPALRGVLFDLPQVVAGAVASDRYQIVGGDFFKEVPASDAYIMKHIIHDWSDDQAVAIFKSIQRASKPGAKLLLVETVLKPGNEPDPGKLLDLEMLIMTNGGRERTEPEFRAILAAAGFTLTRVVPTQSPVSVVEATRV